MNLTALIGLPHVRTLLDEITPQYETFVGDAPVIPTRAPGSGWRFGTAFDYAVRMELAIRVPHASYRPWVAEWVRDRLYLSAMRAAHRGYRARIDLWQRVAAIVHDAQAFVVDQAGRRPSRARLGELCFHSLRLGSLDPTYRAGVPLAPDFESPPEAELAELIEMVEFTRFSDFTGRHRLVLNPNFEFGDVKADGDIVVDDCLVDLKTTLNGRVQRPSVRQLLAYMVFDQLRRSVRNKIAPVRFRTLEMYYARFGQWWILPTTEIVSHPEYPRVLRGVAELAGGELTALAGAGERLLDDDRAGTGSHVQATTATDGGLPGSFVDGEDPRLGASSAV